MLVAAVSLLLALTPSLGWIASTFATVAAFAVLVACLVGAALFCLRNRILSWLGLGQTDAFLHLLLAGTDALKRGDYDEAKAALLSGGKAAIHYYSAVKLRVWTVATILALVGALIAATGTLVLVQQNALLQQQNTLVAAQAAVASEQTNLLRTQNEITSRKDKEALLWDLYQSPELGERQGALKQLLSLDVREFPGISMSDAGGASIRVNSFVVPARPGAQILDLSQRGLDEVNFRGAFFSQVTFEGSRLRHAIFMAARVENANFTNCDLTGAVFESASLGGASFDGAKLTSAVLTGVDLANVSFKGTDLGGARLGYSDLRVADLSGAANLHQTSMDHARVRRAGNAKGSTRFPAGFTYEDAIRLGAIEEEQ